MTFLSPFCMNCKCKRHPDGPCPTRYEDYDSRVPCRCSGNLDAHSQVEEDYYMVRGNVVRWNQDRIDRLYEAAKKWEEHELLMGLPH